MKIAITGGVASGKTTVCQLFQKLGAIVVNADAIAHELLDPQTHLGQKVLQKIGSDVLRNGKIDRSLVAEKVFQDPSLLRELERLLHPAILERIEQKYKEACQKGAATLFVVEMPLLFEIGAEQGYDFVIAVQADEAIAKKRFESAGHKSEEYERRMHRQLPQQVKSGKAHFTINNNGALEDLRPQVEHLYAIFTKTN